ncbi:MAG: MFS transporter [Thermoleophilia bacterium]|nr:MFS transporter [Thermoleophilia bacterium]
MTEVAEIVEAPAEVAGSNRRWITLPVISWAMYDFANTIFSLSVLSAYFNSWIVTERHGHDWYLFVMQAFVTVALIATMPLLGAVADRRGVRKPMLVAFTLACIAATFGLGLVSSTIAGLLLGGVAIFCFQSALSHYDPLLAVVGPDERIRGKVSGLGVGLGYVGALFGFVVLGAVVGTATKGHPIHNQDAFLPTAIMFLVFALPCFLFVRNPGRPAGARAESVPQIMRGAASQLRATVKNISGHRDIVRFLIGRFLYADSLSVIITFMVIYLDRLGGFEKTKNVVLASAMITAAIAAMVAGRFVDSIGPRKVLISVVLLVAFGMMVEAITGSSTLIWVFGPLIGAGLGAVWTSDRVFMMRISPPIARGEFFGIYNLVGKVSSAVGQGIWVATGFAVSGAFGWSELLQNRASIAVLALVMVLGAWLVWGVSDAERDWTDDQLERALEEAVAR